MRATRPVRRIAAGVLAAWTAALACNAAQASTDLNARLESEVAPALEAAMHEAGVPGVQVAVLTPDGHVWSRAFGLTDIERGTSLTAGTVLRAASISKLFTATLVMRHVEAGRIALDADVNSYLTPDRRIRDPDGDEVAVTIRQLLSHTSGLPPIGAGLGLGRAFAVWLGLRPEPAFEDYVAGGFTLRRRPGTALRYSNDAYILLGWLCGHLAGTSFAEHVSAELLEPLAMHSSDFRPNAPHLQGHLSRVYDRGEGGPEPAREHVGVWPSGSLFATAEDLLRFAGMVLGEGSLNERRFLEPSTLAQMTRLQAEPFEGAASGFGLGFRVTRYRAHRLLCHEGGNPGVASRMCIAPDARVAVAVLINLNDEDFVYVTTNRVLDALLGLAPWPGAPATRAAPRGAHRLVGDYRSVGLAPDALSFLELLQPFTVSTREGVLRLKVPGRATLWLEPTNNAAEFVLHGGQGEGEILHFRKDAEGRTHAYVSFIHLRELAWHQRPFVLVAASIGTLLGGSGWVLLRRRRSKRAA